MFAIIRALRPKQWTKNGLLFAALIFSQRYTDLTAVRDVVIGFALFCAISSSGYLVNDLRDVEADRLHPKKSKRPIAAGEVPIWAAWALAAVLMTGGVAGGFLLKTGFGIAALSYLVVTLTYSTFFKHTVLLDVMLIATGFVLRAVAGAEAIPVPSSPWFLTCTAFGALFIGFSKRLAEIRDLGDAAGAHRKILDEYSIPMLEQFISIMTGCAIISYALYAVDSGHGPGMLLTVPFVIYGVMRVMYLVEKGEGGAPEMMLLRDWPLQVCIALFGITAITAMRFGAMAVS
ncbi:MAG: decaprenyl-phosphate phosphoribosyltransferase [Deltaproteobacteria bacterium]|nr:decaprenyl-phosphate phosphoribosyltransferase [Deltaproteobacteria bacterium]